MLPLSIYGEGAGGVRSPKCLPLRPSPRFDISQSRPHRELNPSFPRDKRASVPLDHEGNESVLGRARTSNDRLRRPVVYPIDRREHGRDTGAPRGIRTPVTWLRTRHPGPLDDEDLSHQLALIGTTGGIRTPINRNENPVSWPLDDGGGSGSRRGRSVSSLALPLTKRPERRYPKNDGARVRALVPGHPAAVGGSCSWR